MQIAGADQLAEESILALRIAAAAALERTGPGNPDSYINSWDLLVGLLLANPGQSEAELTFRHFGLVAGQALPDDYPQLTVEGLSRHLNSKSPEPVSNLGEDAYVVV